MSDKVGLVLGRVRLVGKLISIIMSFSYDRLTQKIRAYIHKFTYKKLESPRNIVIIGASFAGYTAAHYLVNSVPSSHQIIVIEKNSHFHFTWAFPRFSVITGHEQKAFIPYKLFLAGAPKDSYVWIKDTVDKVFVQDGLPAGGYVQLRYAKQIPFEYLIVSSGVSAQLPSRTSNQEKQDGINDFKVVQAELESATDIVVIGGGPVGVEYAADAKSMYPEKSVTLVHSRDALLNKFEGSKLHYVVFEKLKKIGVDVILGDRLLTEEIDTNGNLKLLSGREIKCSYLVKCLGQTPNSSILRELNQSCLTESGHVKVRPTLQLEDHRYNNIFAAGDIVSMDCARNGRSATVQGEIAAENIVRSIKHQKLREYEPQWWEQIINITVGLKEKIAHVSHGGSAELLFQLSSKNIDLDSVRVWKYLGADPFNDREFLSE
ncbi:mercuric reductase [Dipodascopsis uninucleata]